MDSEDVGKRVEAVRSIRSQRDAAQRTASVERLRREIREAFERQDARDRDDGTVPGRQPDPGHDSD